MCDPRLLFGGNKELQARCVAAGKTESWLWGAGRSLVQTMAALAAAEGEAGASGVCISPCAAPWNLTAGAALPAVPERLPAALARYEAAVRSIGDQMLGRKVLVVTHGEALRAVVAMAAKEAVVYEVEHTGYVKLTRRPAAAGSTGGGRGSDDGSSGCVKWGEWQLETKSGETGVMWCT